jgi:hypothetical protein
VKHTCSAVSKEEVMLCTVMKLGHTTTSQETKECNDDGSTQAFVHPPPPPKKKSSFYGLSCSDSDLGSSCQLLFFSVKGMPIRMHVQEGAMLTAKSSSISKQYSASYKNISKSFWTGCLE